MNRTIEDGSTPLHEAAGAGSVEVAEMLVRAGAKVSQVMNVQAYVSSPAALSLCGGAFVVLRTTVINCVHRVIETLRHHSVSLGCARGILQDDPTVLWDSMARPHDVVNFPRLGNSYNLALNSKKYTSTENSLKKDTKNKNRYQIQKRAH